MRLTIKNRNNSYHSLTDLPKRQKQVYEAILLHSYPNGVTNRFLSRYLNLPINSITGRVKELRQKGLVEECGDIYDNTTGRTVTTFKTTEKSW